MALFLETLSFFTFNPKTLSSLPNNPITTSHKQLIKHPQSHSATPLSFSLINDPCNSKTYGLILDFCESPSLGKQVHAYSLKMGFHGHNFVETKLLQMYAKCGCFDNAARLFDKMLERNLYSYIAMITLYLGNGLFEEAFGLYKDLIFEGVVLEFFLFPVVLKICVGIGRVELGRQLHGVVIKNGFFSNTYVGNALIDMYGKCGSLVEAQRVFNVMPEKDRVSWNSMITGYAATGMVLEAMEMLEKMTAEFAPNIVLWTALIGGFSRNGYDLEAIEMLYRMKASGFLPNAQTLASVFPSCARLEMLNLGKEMHGYINRHGYISNPIVVNGLLDVYRKCGDMESARKVFGTFSVKNVVSYNTMIVGYCESGQISEAKDLFDKMEGQGMRRDVISWNSLISGYVDNSMFTDALSVYIDLLTEEEVCTNSFTLGSVLTACTETGSSRLGKEVHSQAIVRGLHLNSFVGRALIVMCCKFEDMRAAQVAFDEVIDKDIPTWNTLISCYAHRDEVEFIPNILQKMKEDGFDPSIYTWNGIIAGHVENGRYELGMQLFAELQFSNFRTDIYTNGIILPACSRLATVERGKQVHAHSIRFGYECDVHIGASLVDMYAKCGKINYAERVFYRIKSPRSLVSYNAMLTAYAMYGFGEEGLVLFHSLLTGGLNPDSVTFLSALSSCVHVGAVKEGREIFDLMGDYSVNPTLKHYTCIVDLLSRAGHIEEAYEVFKNMSFEPDSVICGALLGGCVTHCCVDIGEEVASMLIKMEPDNTGNYVMLVNLYASAGRWNDVARTRKLMREKQMHKDPGCSWIEVRYETNVFVASDTSHVRSDEIYATLDNLTVHMRS